MDTDTLPSRTLSTREKRRFLTAQGRTTTPGVFTMPLDDPQVPEIEATDAAPVSGVGDSAAVTGEKEMAAQEQLVIGEKQTSVQQPTNEEIMCAIKTPPIEVVMNPPVSKVHTDDPKGSFSFYTRPFKVSGQQAWECAMRSLGSVDTLFNRYGYVSPGLRRETISTHKQSGKATSHEDLLKQ